MADPCGNPHCLILENKLYCVANNPNILFGKKYSGKNSGMGAPLAPQGPTGPIARLRRAYSVFPPQGQIDLYGRYPNGE